MLVRPSVVVGEVSVRSTEPNLQIPVEETLKSYFGGRFSAGEEEFARWNIERLLRRQGYFGGQVQFRRLTVRKAGDQYALDVNVIVDAGPKYRVSAISGDGGPLFQGNDLSQYFKAHVGDPASPVPFGDLGLSLRGAYIEYGFADVQIRTNQTLDRDHATVAYNLQVIPGPVYHLGNLTIEGLVGNQEKRVRETLDMKPGDTYRETAINRLYGQIRKDAALMGFTFSFSPKRDKEHGTMNLDLKFEKEGGDAKVTVQ
jgi:outer membrane protein assembly factor BamA